MFGWNKNTSNKLNRLVELQLETVSRAQLKEMLYDAYDMMYIWGRTEKENKQLRKVEVYSVQGPGGRAMGGARYWTNRYVNGGYVILYNTDKSGFRTYPINKITHIEKDGQKFKVK